MSLAFALVITVPFSVLAQSQDGPGISLGDFELHPGIGVEGGYDSNLFLTQDNPSPPATYVSTGVLRVTPRIAISSRSGEREQGEGETAAAESQPLARFRASFGAAYYEFFAAPERRNLDLNGDFRLTLLPGRTFTLSIYDSFVRATRPFTENVRPDVGTGRIRNTAGLDLGLQSDGGVLSGQLTYQFGLNFFEGDVYAYGNAFDHMLNLQQTWKFLPNTAFVTDVTANYNDYTNASLSPLALNDSVRLRARVGLNGAVTDQFSASAMIGYSAGFFAGATATYRQDYDALVAQLEVRYQFTESTRLSLGYDRDYQPSYLGNFAGRDRGYAGFQATFGQVVLNAEGDVAFIGYGVALASDGSLAGDRATRNDIRVTGSLTAEYRFTPWFGVNATGRYTGVFTDYQYRVTAAAPFLDPASYNKFEAYGGVRVFY